MASFLSSTNASTGMQGSMAHARQDGTGSLSYVACHLRRNPFLSQQQQAWGMWVSMVDSNKDNNTSQPQQQQQVLTVGAVQHPIFDALLEWSWVTSTPPQTTVIWKPSYSFDLWKTYFALLPRQQDHQHTLMTGDIIIAINGLPLAAFGGSISNVTAYMQQCSQLFLVAARSGTPERKDCQAAKQALTLKLVQDILQQLPFQTVPTSQPPISLPPPVQVQTPIQTPPPSSFTLVQLQQQLARLITPESHNNNNTIAQTTTIPTSAPRQLPVVSSSQSQSKGAAVAVNHKESKQSKNEAKLKTTVKRSLSLLSSPHIHHNNQHSYYTNPLFTTTKKPRINNHNDNNNHDDSAVAGSDNTNTHAIPYADNKYEYDPEEGNHCKHFLVKIDSSSFQHWMTQRKQSWRSKWNVKATVSAMRTNDFMANTLATLPMVGCTNPMFPVSNNAASSSDENNNANANEQQPSSSSTAEKFIPYCDNITFDPYEGTRSKDFLTRIDSSNFQQWMVTRKRKWRSNWKPYQVESTDESTNTDGHHHHYHHNACAERSECSVRYDFWADEHETFDSWLTTRTAKWKKLYSWNSRKRQRIQQMREEVVRFQPSDTAEFQKWLRVRKNQWRILRRQRQRRIEEAEATTAAKPDQELMAGATTPSASHSRSAVLPASCKEKYAVSANHHISGDFLHIDTLLEEEEEERERKLHRERKPTDISFLFHPSRGCPDDVTAHCLQYLHHSEHGKLLCISKSFAEGIKSRGQMWQHLCPTHWNIPRRPRKPWHELYLSKLRLEAYASRKQWDDLLTKVADVLFRGDQLKVLQKLIAGAEKKFAFTVDYISGVVCERNSILNLAVIHRRHKVVHWLVEQKNADIETSDRGHFTPLINAAWGGDKKLVRFLLHHGADRSKVGMGHSSEALATNDFEGHTAEEWAREKGHDDIATLIRVGL